MSRRTFARRLLLGVGGGTLLAVVLGCMNLSIGGRSATFTPIGEGSESGEVPVPGFAELDVYYPAPFASPPNLVLDSARNGCTPIEQHADRFRVRNCDGLPRTVTWKARGVRAAPPAAVMPESGTPRPTAAAVP